MRRVSFDNFTITHGKQSSEKPTVLFDECLPGKYVACIYDKHWFIGNVLLSSLEHQDIRVKFMMQSNNNHFNWPRKEDLCWVPINHVLCLIKTISAQSADARGYYLSETEFNTVLELFEKFSS